IRGFGSFKIKKREPRQGRNPKTGENISILAKKVPFFKAGKEIRERINKA
ncbi:MAG: HU family DNA-binding protein, partial [Deltaproteobacteria bacterium]